MKKKLKLRKWVKITLTIFIAVLTIQILSSAIKSMADRYDELYKECDESRGYTCSYYDMRQYSIGK